MIAALIIAAAKTAYSEGLPPQKELGAIPALQRTVMLFQRAGIERVVVVCEEDGEKTEKLASHRNVVFLHHRVDAELLDSVKTGLAYLQDKCTATMITLADLPFFSIDTLRALMSADGPVSVPSYEGKDGQPILIHAESFPAILSYAGEGGLVGAIEASGLRRNFIEVDDEGILIHTKDDEDYAAYIAEHSLRQSYPDFRFRIVREKAFYGPGAHQLMQLTEETNSLREACRRMGISYGKGRAILSLMEQQLGYPVVESRQGGSAGGYSAVTDKGKELMDRYSAYCTEARAYLQDLFYEVFPD